MVLAQLPLLSAWYLLILLPWWGSTLVELPSVSPLTSGGNGW